MLPYIFAILDDKSWKYTLHSSSLSTFFKTILFAVYSEITIIFFSKLFEIGEDKIGDTNSFKGSSK